MPTGHTRMASARTSTSARKDGLDETGGRVAGRRPKSTFGSIRSAWSSVIRAREERIFVYTPERTRSGSDQPAPRRWTFAYRVHTEVGHRTWGGARVDGRPVALESAARRAVSGLRCSRRKTACASAVVAAPSPRLHTHRPGQRKNQRVVSMTARTRENLEEGMRALLERHVSRVSSMPLPSKLRLIDRGRRQNSASRR